MSRDKVETFDVFSVSYKENNDSDSSDCDDHEPVKDHLARISVPNLLNYVNGRMFK